jgi:HemY protein
LGLLAFGLLYLLIRTLVRLWSVPRRVQRWERRRAAERSRLNLVQGVLDMAEGRWGVAEKALLRQVEDSELALLSYLAAAHCADRQGDSERRDRYLSQAHASRPAADVPVRLILAEAQLEDGQYEQALATLNHLQEIAPGHVQVLGLLQRLFERRQDWERLRDLLPELRKRKVLTEGASAELEIRVHKSLLAKAGRESDSQRLGLVWNQVPKGLRTQPRVLEAYAGALLERHQGDLAEPLLREAIEQGWDDHLARLYGLAKGKDLAKQLTSAESWLKTQPENPVLLLTLGRLCQRTQLWGKARSYFEASIEFGRLPESYRDLAGLLERLGERERAVALYRKGLAQLTGPALDLPMPGSAAVRRTPERSVEAPEAATGVALVK